MQVNRISQRLQPNSKLIAVNSFVPNFPVLYITVELGSYRQLIFDKDTFMFSQLMVTLPAYVYSHLSADSGMVIDYKSHTFWYKLQILECRISSLIRMRHTEWINSTFKDH